MFKKIFKAAKDLVKSPAGQLGIGLLLPGSSFATGLAAKQGLAGLAGKVLTNPALLQSGIGLLAGDKPANVLRNLAYGTALGGISNLDQPDGFMGGAREYLGMQPSVLEGGQTAAQNLNRSGGSFSVGEVNPNQDTLDFIDRELGIGNTVPITSDMNTALRLGTGSGGVGQIPQPEKEGFLERLGLIQKTQVITNPDGSQSVIPVTNFFDKYAPMLALGQVGLQVAAATLGQQQAERLYDPNQNPYLKGDTQISDVYTPLEYNKGGGVMDFPDKDGMIDGPGDGQSDDIPAMLSDGEFVMTKQAVMAAGNGDRDKGTDRMYEMMNSLEDKAQNMGIGKF
jgi:hypothetical protein